MHKTGGPTHLDYDIAVIGGGPAGLAAAAAAYKNGGGRVVILERDKELGGILNQCIHNGFGLHTFHEELTGPEYADRFIREVAGLPIDILPETMVLEVGRARSAATGFCLLAMNRRDGLFKVRAGAVVLAMGCRERPRGALNIPGSRPAGIYSAGTAQRLVNREGYMPGREVVILGSGDIGLIMARRMTLEGAHVKVVAELMPYSGGLKRNIVQCLDDFGIPLKLSHTVVDIHGRGRLTGVTLARVDANSKPVAGTEEYIPCDTLLLSVGLIPENELTAGMGVGLHPVTGGPRVNESFETDLPGVFACGNVLHVHDLVDYVSEEAALAGENAAAYVRRVSYGGGTAAAIHDGLPMPTGCCVSPGGGTAAAMPGQTQATGGEDPCNVNAQREYGVRSGESRILVDDIEATGDAVADVGNAADGTAKGSYVVLTPGYGVRYTVPSVIRMVHMPEKLKVRFRVGGIYRGASIGVYCDGRRILTKKRLVMAPGEMEEVLLERETLEKFPLLREITVCVEEAGGDEIK
ncbi:MAG: FAD-dependent oxidoreductase [Lachnospiraceae bacterium]|jgi:NADPH-dependent 2,4-dienoyl-CoA reductase/sulfur reductase-like enzyme|nr:FAD-dependent oxidoreductase [Lachnospiraceae bacterium]